jgi:hypothetical protein
MAARLRTTPEHSFCLPELIVAKAAAAAPNGGYLKSF